MRLEDVKTLDQGIHLLHVVRLDFSEWGYSSGPKEAFVFPLMKRKDGLMCAVPMDVFPDEVLDGGNSSGMADLIGPSKRVSLPAVLEEEDGVETPLDSEIDCLLMDFNSSILEHLRGFDPVTEGEDIVAFWPDNPDIFPEANALIMSAYSWVEEGGDRVKFYSAEEEELVAASTAGVKKGRTKVKTANPSKRVTTASLAEQLAAISEAIPSITEQLQSMASRQDKFDIMLASPQPLGQERVPAYRQAFNPPDRDAKGLPSSFLKGIGSPPRVRPAPERRVSFTGDAEKMQEDEPVALPSEPDYVASKAPEASSSSEVNAILLQQSQALTHLVAHLTSQDGLPDLGSSTSSTLSMRGSQKRDKLLADLGSRKGAFFLKVSQNAFRRLKPTEPVPASLEDFQKKGIFTKYLERQGGYSHQRDMGLVMWLLAFVADQMLAGDHAGAQEMLALAMVAIEQEWATVALGFVKEVDLISSRRQESLGVKKQENPMGGPKKQDDKEAWKKKPRFPKKGKQEESTS
ncbi:Uncharacterized protein SCF082_LOCUS52739 [Durusdinium trenchii]|uniref:Uncharacterized protein n=1 Tax=Durusdinium trenchii TaxID=1381693 RepID=A0ABP0SNP6_9DINO